MRACCINCGKPILMFDFERNNGLCDNCKRRRK